MNPDPLTDILHALVSDLEDMGVVCVIRDSCTFTVRSVEDPYVAHRQSLVAKGIETDQKIPKKFVLRGDCQWGEEFEV